MKFKLKNCVWFPLHYNSSNIAPSVSACPLRGENMPQLSLELFFSALLSHIVCTCSHGDIFRRVYIRLRSAGAIKKRDRTYTIQYTWVFVLKWLLAEMSRSNSSRHMLTTRYISGMKLSIVQHRGLQTNC